MKQIKKKIFKFSKSAAIIIDKISEALSGINIGDLVIMESKPGEIRIIKEEK